jgi:hypothetical protein
MSEIEWMRKPQSRSTPRIEKQGGRQHKWGETSSCRIKPVAVAVLIAVFSVAAEAQPAAPTAPTVTIDSGKLAGHKKDGMMSFLGIPYASPPTGDQRGAHHSR